MELEWTGTKSPYLVRGNRTILKPGMTFSNEPGIYVAGRLRDALRRRDGDRRVRRGETLDAGIRSIARDADRVASRLRERR